jgi:hypothetical protein
MHGKLKMILTVVFLAQDSLPVVCQHFEETSEAYVM